MGLTLKKACFPDFETEAYYFKIWQTEKNKYEITIIYNHIAMTSIKVIFHLLLNINICFEIFCVFLDPVLLRISYIDTYYQL